MNVNFVITYILKMKFGTTCHQTEMKGQIRLALSLCFPVILVVI